MSAMYFLFFSCIALQQLFAFGSRFDPSTVPPLGPPPDVHLTTSELLQRAGYEGEEYRVTTEDGYLLKMTRLVKADLSPQTGPPVLMVNGLGLLPEVYVLHGKGHDLAFVLADLGYDVWLGAQRGLVGSRDHVNSNITEEEYWNFSHDESGRYDLPAMIDLMLSKSSEEKVLFVGTSIGGLLFFVMCSERPDYCDKVAGNVQFVPSYWVPRYTEHTLSNRVVIGFIKALVEAQTLVRQYSIPTSPEGISEATFYGCRYSLTEWACFESLNIITGFDSGNMAEGWLSFTLSYCSGGMSLRQMEHLLQLYDNGGGINKYDWGTEKNLERYNSTTPPPHELSRISSPTFVIYSKGDTIIPHEITERALAQIGNLAKVLDLWAKDPTYGHAEFVFGKDLYKLTFPEVVDFFDSVTGLGSKFNNTCPGYNY